jgi:protein-S-isoprenylcysteine O-methyltransferase Ste14
VNFTARVFSILTSTALYLALAISGWGGFAAFFSHPALWALAVSLCLVSTVALFAGGSLSPGVKEDRGNRWVLPVLIGLGLISPYVCAYTDRVEFWTLDGDSTRWSGVLLFIVGSVLRLWPVFVLGNRFSGLVAIQPNHSLVTDGIYSRIRHPSYVGLLVGSLGWALAFRSGVGALLVVLMVPVVIARIDSEERLLGGQFGSAYEAYKARTWRLIPMIY